MPTMQWLLLRLKEEAAAAAPAAAGTQEEKEGLVQEEEEAAAAAMTTEEEEEEEEEEEAEGSVERRSVERERVLEARRARRLLARRGMRTWKMTWMQTLRRLHPAPRGGPVRDSLGHLYIYIYMTDWRTSS